MVRSGSDESTAAPFDTTVWRAVGDPLVAARARGPLDGTGVAVKDLFAVAGQPIGAGVPAWLAEQRPHARSAGAVAALLDAGAHIVGSSRSRSAPSWSSPSPSSRQCSSFPYSCTSWGTGSTRAVSACPGACASG
nr:amidase family protein [Streptomyces sp. NBC_00857]